MSDFEKKIRPKLKKDWTTGANFIIFREVKDYFIKMDNYYREAKENREKRHKGKKEKTIKKVAFYKPLYRRSSLFYDDSVVTPKREKDVYNLCGKTGYWASDCPIKDSHKQKYEKRREKLKIQIINNAFNTLFSLSFSLSESNTNNSSDSEN